MIQGSARVCTTCDSVNCVSVLQDYIQPHTCIYISFVENLLGDPPPPPNLVKILPSPIHLDPTMHSARIPLRDPLGTSEKVLISTIRPIVLHRRPQKPIGNYGLGARLPGSFTGGAEPIEDSPLTKRNTPMTNNPGGNTPARKISSAVTSLMALEAMWAISNTHEQGSGTCQNPKVPAQN